MDEQYKKMIRALLFYAEPSNWQGSIADLHEPRPIDLDDGKQAREALKED